MSWLYAKENPRYKRVAYICEHGGVKYTGDEGYSSVMQAFVERPAGCHFCVFERTDGTAMLVDLFELRVRGGVYAATASEVVAQYKAAKQFPTVDAAIVYGAMTC